MIRVRQIKLSINSNLNDIKKECSKRLNVNIDKIKTIRINKQSLDARKKPVLFFVYEVDIEVDCEKEILNKKIKDVIKTPDEVYHFSVTGSKKLNYRPVIVGSGPAGLFCGYMLGKAGYRPIIIERGECIEKRIKTVAKFWEEGILNQNSNVQFGEGGAGTFSDGKLNSQVKDSKNRINKMLEIFVEAGAPKDIMYIHNPHIGTDLLRDIVINIRKKIISYGGEFHYNTCLTDINIENNKIVSIEVNNHEIINSDVLILAIGHSARDTFYKLYEKKLNMKAKPFAVGVRLQHPQSLIDYNQYGSNSTGLPSASYKLTYKASNGRGVYSFCMCPGGYVVNASSDNQHLVINGMSNHKRDSGNANSAIIVTVNPIDFGTHPLDGIKYQEKLESKAYQVGNGKIPVQLFGDYRKNKVSTTFKNIKPIFKGGYKFADLNQIYPQYINESLKEGILNFDKKIPGFSSEDVVIAGVESRTSSPIRIIRDDNLESNIEGIYPCGEGAGYAGGITSSAIDGIKIAEQIAKIYKS